MNSTFWQKTVYHYVFIGCGLFVLLTIIAMFTYPGGIYRPAEVTDRYDFLRNFFSDLGRTTVEGGKSNLTSAILFFIALSIAGIGLVYFFVAFRIFFKDDPRVKVWSLAGTITGAASGACFVGIACAPYDLVFDVHYQLVFWAFRFFFIAVGIYTYVIFRQDRYPRQRGWVFVAFSVLLAAYIALLEFGPSTETTAGLMTQAVGQKIIVYVSIISIMLQSRLAYLDQDASK